MGCKIDFSLTPQYDTMFEKIDLRTADDVDFEFNVLYGIHDIRFNEINFSPPGIYQVMGLALEMWRISQHLKNEKRVIYLFEGTSYAIFFKKNNDQITVSTNYMSELTIISLIDLTESVTEHAHTVYTSLCRYFPILKENKKIPEWYPVPHFPLPICPPYNEMTYTRNTPHEFIK